MKGTGLAGVHSIRMNPHSQIRFQVWFLKDKEHEIIVKCVSKRKRDEVSVWKQWEEIKASYDLIFICSVRWGKLGKSYRGRPGRMI